VVTKSSREREGGEGGGRERVCMYGMELVL